MIVNSHNIEFGYELLSAIPYAYELYLKGELTGTVSGELSEPLYYFSPSHVINKERRSWFNTDKARRNGLPYTWIHQPELQPKHFPPYKEQYANTEFKFDKPTLCICNRINVEWDFGPINFFNEQILDWLFENLKDKYHIIYFPVAIPENIRDQVDPIQLDDISVCKKHGVTVFTSLLNGRNWNEVMLKVFANCTRYITMNGGYSILASFFSGQNIVYSKPGPVETKEIKMGSFWRWYANINNVQTLHVPSYDALKEKVKALYIDELPTANVLIRTSKRPNYFKKCIDSVLRQTYKNVNIVVISDETGGKEYTKGYPCRVIHPDPVKPIQRPNRSEDYGNDFPANDYLNQAQQKVEGFIFFLDDDDLFTSPQSIEKVMQFAKPDKLTVWKVNMKSGVIPSHSFGKKPTLYDITGIGLCYHSSQIHLTDWTPFKRADYRTAKGFKNIVWIDSILTEIQEQPGNGLQKDVSPLINYKDMAKNEKILVNFIRNFGPHKKGDKVWLAWIEAVNLQYRKMVEVVEDEKELEPKTVKENDELIVLFSEVKRDEIRNILLGKEEKAEYETKELKPVRKTKKTRK
jgi:glycosyltransferase involved in cell wall biosynthesis